MSNNLTKISRLTIIPNSILKGSKEDGYKKKALYKCACGTIKQLRVIHVNNKSVLSCGCLKKETSKKNGQKNRIHGHSYTTSNPTKSPEYYSWLAMRGRCLCPTDPSYIDYGGRGIKICTRWDSFLNFLEDMGNRPKGTTLDRINVDGDYSPDNCRWESYKAQGRNKRSNRLVIFEGALTPLIIVAEKTGIPYQRLHERIIRRKWSVEKAISTPSKRW